MINPSLTTLKQPLELIASTALDIISNPGGERREAILPVEFLRGQTT
jgi:LacI family transcriptional regulator